MSNVIDLFKPRPIKKEESDFDARREQDEFDARQLRDEWLASREGKD